LDAGSTPCSGLSSTGECALPGSAGNETTGPAKEKMKMGTLQTSLHRQTAQSAFVVGLWSGSAAATIRQHLYGGRGPSNWKDAGRSETSGKSVFSRFGLTLVELLAVLAIIGILSAILIPAIFRTKTQSKTQRARIEMAQIAAAVANYESGYGTLPVSEQANRAAALTSEDMTYGGLVAETQTWLAGPGYLTNNCEVMAVLLDLEFYGDGAATINLGHVKNPRHSKLLEASMAGGTNATPGIGVDGLYRDPWGSPYVLTLDLNRDGRLRDALYRRPEVSQDPDNPERGLVGLVKTTTADGTAVFEASGRIIVWSAGPDRHLSTEQKANQGVNRDNVLSWWR
jgi:prepilin-type N-terminal cleavage/methylation domain-containing protein